MNSYELLCKLSEVGLAHRAVEMERFLLSAIRVNRHTLEADSLPIGTSKLGGLPDLPEGVEWPHCQPLRPDGFYTELQQQGGPLWFLGQINLAEVTRLDYDRVLPETGMLYFFCALWRDAFPQDGSTGDSWKVIYFDGELARLQRTRMPPVPDSLQQIHLGPEHSFQTKPCAITFSEFAMLPWNLYEKISLTYEHQDIFWRKFWHVHHGSGHQNHHLLGYSQPVQWNYMQLCCEEFFAPENLESRRGFLSAKEVYASDKERQRWYRTLDKERSRRAKWRLLFQVDTDPEIDLEWQAWARGYFWIRKADLAARNFEHVCLVNQHT